jgi:uncharacterized protein DUF3489
MPDPRLMCGVEVQSKYEQFEAAEGCLTPTFELLFLGNGAMDVIGRAATLYRKRGMNAMLFHLTTEDHIGAMNEHELAETTAGGTTFTSEQELHELATEWPMKRLVAIWNHLPGVQAVTRFTDRKTAITRIWRAVQPQTEPSRTPARRASKPQHHPMFREGSKAAQVLTLLRRAEGATLNEIRNQTGWQAHTVRGFISRNLSKQSRKVRSFERDGVRVYRFKM